MNIFFYIQTFVVYSSKGKEFKEKLCNKFLFVCSWLKMDLYVLAINQPSHKIELTFT